MNYMVKKLTKTPQTQLGCDSSTIKGIGLPRRAFRDVLQVRQRVHDASMTPPCLNSVPADRGPVRSRFTSDGPDSEKRKFLNICDRCEPRNKPVR
jgi:hypothetical protein